MNNQLGGFFADLPVILAGPMLQHTDSESVTVFVALKQPCEVELKVYQTSNDGASLENCLMQGRRLTVALGKHLHIVAITAQSQNGKSLTSNRIYAYDLQFKLADETSLSLEAALRCDRFPQVSISYFPHQKPTFVLPPDSISDLQIVHASCRKPHGHGIDALPLLDSLIESTATQPRYRPHQLFLTGDQIYGDDVADPFLWVATNLGDALLGWEEKLPLDTQDATPKQLLPGERSPVATDIAGFTAGLHKSDKASSHLLSLGEYYAAYILVWSPICWPDAFPQGSHVTSNRQNLKAWNQALKYLRQFLHTLPKVRRALANIPMYTICDDHDVSDDWNLNQAWCLRVLGNPLGRRTVQNALLAYSVFQAWGNTPEQFTSGEPGEKLLAAASQWSKSQGMDMEAYQAIARYIGIPDCNPHTGLPNFVLEDGVFILERHPEALRWDYIVNSNCHQVIVLDTRTWRGYPADQKAIAPPMLLCPRAMRQQLLQPLQQTAKDHQLTTFVIAPTNVFGLQVIDWIHHWQLKEEKVFSTDVGDAWNVNFPALAQLLSTLFAHRQKLVILTGDIHYSCAARLTYAATLNSRQPSVLVQLTASALKNEETLTRLIHTRLKDWLLPEKVRHWVGWNNPANMQEISAKQLHRRKEADWYCTLEWIPRQRTQTFLNNVDVSSFIIRGERQNRRWRWLQPLNFWQSSWFQDGREVVGLNNLALVHFGSDDADNSFEVIQDVYWFSTTSSTKIVYSRFSQ